jgi:hypothetical protein
MLRNHALLPNLGMISVMPLLKFNDFYAVLQTSLSRYN